MHQKDQIFNTLITDQSNKTGQQFKCIETDDIWEKFTINFTVFHPSLNQNENIHIIGSKPELGNWNPLGVNSSREEDEADSEDASDVSDDAGYGNPIRMERYPNAVSWLCEKYGCKM